MGIQIDLQKVANKERAVAGARYFKTGKGEYGEGDVFLGLTVPQVRTIAKKYKDLPLKEIEKLLHDPIHEYRLTALFILMDRFKKADEGTRKRFYDFYLTNTKWINNWDLIDLSSRDIVGGYLINKPKERKILIKLAKSKSIWERRIAMIATFAFIKKKELNDTFALATILVRDTHDLIHKAVGWALREAGKVDRAAEEAFLMKYYKTMPRTMLRYAIEKFDEKRRAQYLHGKI